MTTTFSKTKNQKGKASRLVAALSKQQQPYYASSRNGFQWGKKKHWQQDKAYRFSGFGYANRKL